MRAKRVTAAAPCASNVASRLSLSDLSNEILIEIIKFASEQSPKHILSLARCSRHLQQVTEPILYRNARPARRSHCISLQRFLATLVARPDLSHHVRAFYTLDYGPTHENEPASKLPLDSGDWERINTAIRNEAKTRRQSSKWRKAIESGSWDATTALTLRLLPNLRELDLEDWCYEAPENYLDMTVMYPCLTSLFEMAADLQCEGVKSTAAMSNLRKVSLWNNSSESGLEFYQLEIFLDIPSVTSFSADEVLGDDGSGESWLLFSLPYATTQLHITNGDIDADSLCRFLHLFPSLELLQYNSRYEWDEAADAPDLVASIEHLKPCLKALIFIDENLIAPPDFHYGLEEYPTGSLGSFQRLEVVDVMSTILFGHSWEQWESASQNVTSIFPSTLIHLHLRDCRAVRVIFELISNKRQCFPALETIDLDWERVVYPDRPSPPGPFIHPGFSKEQAEELYAKCEQAGVKMVMVTNPPKPKRITLTVTKPHPRGAEFGEVTWSYRQQIDYPYDGYEELCEKHGLDPKTGAAWEHSVSGLDPWE